MSPERAIFTPISTPAPDTLRALQLSLVHGKIPPSHTRELPLPESYLDLRAVRQVSFDEVHSAFPMMDPSFPVEWKEQIRQLRDRLKSAQAELENPGDILQVLAFTNLDGRRDRRGTVTNLALAMASIQDTRVLVIDANLCAPTIHHKLHQPSSPGLCEAIRADRADLPRCFRRVTGTQVYLLPIGDTESCPMDPLDLHNLLQALRSQFDWILIDAPGFDNATDALAITMTADGVIMVIESNQDSYRLIAKALSSVQGRRLLGAVMY